MKNLIALTSLICIFNFCRAQEIPPAPEGKAVVYFARTASMGFAINFTYFDSAAVIGRFNGPKYIRYECDPGRHLFWARSENKDFIEADLEAGKIYFVEAAVKMGAVKAGVELIPIDPKDTKKMERVFKLMKKKSSEQFTEQELQIEAKNYNDVIVRGLEKYADEQKKGKSSKRLERNMFYQP
jgi:hypothetical protein